jgi:spore germination protein KB
MLEKAKITNLQTICLMIMLVSSTGILTLPTLVYKAAKQDAWLTMIVVGVLGIIVAYILTRLGLMFSGKTIIQFSEKILGKPLGKIIGFIYCVFFIHINAVVIRQFSDILAGHFFSNAPVLFFSIAIMIISIYAVLSGIEVIARVNEIIFPIFLVVTNGIILLSIGDMDFKNFMPVLENGWAPILEGAYLEMYFISEIVVLLMLMPYINQPENTRKSMYIGIVALAVFGIIIFGGIGAVFGSTHASNINYPFNALARYVRVGDFIVRVESFVVFIWVTGVSIKIALFHYCAVMAISQWLNLKSYKPLVIPVGGVMVVLSMVIVENIMEMGKLLTKIVVIPYLFIEIGIPFLLLIIALLRKKGDKTYVK